MQPPGNLLYLIENYQCVTRCSLLPRNGLQGCEDAFYIVVKVEDLLHSGLVITVDIHHLTIFLLSEMPHNPGFTHLSGSEEHEWAPVLTILPFQETTIYLPAHNYLTFRLQHHKVTLFR